MHVDYRELCSSGCFETRISSDSYFEQQVRLQWRLKPSVFKVAVRGSIPEAEEEFTVVTLTDAGTQNRMTKDNPR